MLMRLSKGTLGLCLFLVLAQGMRAQDVDDRVQQLYAEAKTEEKAGHVDVAIQKYQAIIRLSPNLAAAHNNLGRLYSQQNRLEDAIKCFQQAVKLDPSLAAPHAQMGLAYFQMADYASAIKEFKAALKLNPRDSNAKLYLARSLTERGEYKEAQKFLEQLHQANPKDVQVLYDLGTLYSLLAQTTLGEIQKIAPDSFLVEVLLGRYSEIRKVYPEAIEHYKRAIERAPDNPNVHYLHAHALYASGDFQGALEGYRRTLELDPYDYRASLEAARVVLPENPEEALRLANRTLDIKPDVAEAFAIRGRAQLAFRKPKEALEDLKKANALDPAEPTVHFQLARAYRQLGMTQEAQAEIAVYERMQKEAHTKGESQDQEPKP